MARGKVIVKGGTDHIVIPNVRTAIRQAFTAGLWTDLRVGFFLSVTKAASDDDPTSLGETISNVNNPYDCYWIGLKSAGEAFPYAGAQSFVGFTNAPGLHPPDWRDLGESKLVSSDIGVGTSNAYYWRPTTSGGDDAGHGFSGFLMLNYTDGQGALTTGWEQHFVQDVTGVGKYCGALGFRILRDQPTDTHFRVEVKANDTNSCDLGYSSTPTADALLTLLESWPTSVRTSNEAFLSALPFNFFFYWPFHSSRLRIHSRGFVRVR